MAEDENFRTVEINGVKLEVDLRTARKVESYKVGDQVKVLVKEYSKYTPYPGVIVGFDDFEKLPTITVAYLKVDYSGAKVEFVYLNSENDEDKAEIAPYHDDILVDKQRVLDLIDRDIEKKFQEMGDLQAKRAYFERNFGRYFSQFEALANTVDDAAPGL